MAEPLNLVDKRCFHHASRESVACCLQCNRFFCRECVNEHGGRLLCSDCLLILTATRQDKPSKLFHRLLPPLRLGVGILLTWMVFYLLGQALVSIPTSIHDGSIWNEQTTR